MGRGMERWFLGRGRLIGYFRILKMEGMEGLGKGERERVKGNGGGEEKTVFVLSGQETDEVFQLDGFLSKLVQVSGSVCKRRKGTEFGAGYKCKSSGCIFALS